MRRIALIALAVGALLVGGLVAPSLAGEIRFGRTWAADKVLREGCHGYRYQYVVRPGTNDWSFETFLRNPSGRMIASNGFHFGADPKRGAGSFRFCNDVTRTGRYKIAGKLTWRTCNDLPGPLNECKRHVHWVKPGFFQMRRPG
jgi:hypothetical protein